MSTRARKDRKRAGIQHVKPRKVPTSPYLRPGTVPTLGLTSRAEILAGMVVRDALRDEARRVRDLFPRELGPVMQSAGDARARVSRTPRFLARRRG